VNTPSFRSRAIVAIACALVGALTGGLAAAQPAMNDFLPIDKFVFFLDGEEDANAEVYQSQSAGAYLVVPTLSESPLLVQARSAAVSTVNLMKVDRQPNGGVRLLDGAMLAPLGKFTIAGDGIEFSVDGRAAQLRNKPWLLGEQDLEAMRAYSRDYRTGADAYEFSEPLVRQLQAESRPVEVRVFFGTWCPHCQQVLPRVLRVAQELAGSQVALSFYGLPQGDGFSADPEVKRLDIDSVPTAVVFVSGREVGRISGSSWKIPELAIKNAIQGS